MAHTFSTSLFDLPARRSESRFDSLGSVLGRSVAALLAFALLLLTIPSSKAQTPSSYVPPIVVSAVSTVPTTVFVYTTESPQVGTETNVVRPVSVSVDACNNIYVFDTGGEGGADGQGKVGYGTNHDFVTEIPAGGGTANVVEAVSTYYPQEFVANDPTHANLLFGAGYNNHILEVPLVGCVPQTSTIVGVGQNGSSSLFYYYQAASAVGDFQGNTYISTNSVCCGTATPPYYLIKVTPNNEASILLSSQANEIDNLAVDTQQNVYYIAGGIVYQLPINPPGSPQPYATLPVPFGSFLSPTGLTFDSVGNLYVADLGASSIFEIPYEGTSLNLRDEFVISSTVKPDASPAISSRGDIYFIDQKQENVSALTLGYANFNSIPLNTTATQTINFQFNASVTVANVQPPTGAFSIAPAPLGTTPCAAKASYGSGSATSCQITIAFTPTSVAKQTGSVVLVDANGNALATASLEGVGQGPLLTVDPGTISPAGSGLKAPSGIAVDQAGNTFIADAVNNVITEIPAAGGTPVNLAVVSAPYSVTTTSSTGTPTTTKYPALPISAPLGVAVDGAGNLYIADTGNNQVIELPIVNGSYTANLSKATVLASQFLAPGLKSPSGVFVNGNGDLYIADTGDNTIVFYPNTGVTFGAPHNLGSGLNAPLAVTADAVGDLYIADSGNNQIVELPNGAGQETVFANILNPSALATDSSGALFAVDQANLRVLRIPSVNGVLSTNSFAEIALGVANPYGIALDASANLYVTDQKNAASYTFTRTQVALSFGDLAVGTSSGPLPLTVESAGNEPLEFLTPYFTETGNAGDFAMTSPTGACADDGILAVGFSCDIVASFTPSASGSRSAAISVTGEALATPFPSAPNPPVPLAPAVPTTAIVTLTGNGVASAPTTTKLTFTTSTPGAPFYGEPLTFVATVTPTGSAVPTGNVSYVVDGVQAGLYPLVAGVATLPLNSGLTGGTHTVYVIYKGDTANNGSESAPLIITIARAPTASSLVVTNIPFNNPYSLRHSNSGSCSIIGGGLAPNTTFFFPAVQSDSVSFQSGVTSPGVGVPSGTMTFYSDGKLINGPPIPVTSENPNPTQPISVATLVPKPGGLFEGSMTSYADTLGDGDTLGENNILVGPHVITVVYSGDTNYLPSTSVGVVVTVVDVSPTTPVTLPYAPVGAAPYCIPTSPIEGARPSIPGTYEVTASSNTITVSANSPGQSVLTISSLGGWQGGIGFACPNLPKYATCTLNPGLVGITSSNPGNTVLPYQVTLTIATNVPPFVPTAGQSGFLWPAAGLLGLIVLAVRRRVKHIQAGLALFGVMLIFVGGVAGLSSCGSGDRLVPPTLTPVGTYPINLVMTGAEPVGAYNGTGDDKDVFQSDLPYTVPFTLVVK